VKAWEWEKHRMLENRLKSEMVNEMARSVFGPALMLAMRTGCGT